MACYVVGHKTPDSDSIVGAISLAYLKQQIGENAIPVRQGVITPETQFILDSFGLETPMLKTDFVGDELYLIDYSDRAQAPDDLDKATVLGIVDHHKLGDITTSTPLECWIRPVGCSNTIVKDMFDYHNVAIPKHIAGIMMCAILSDTVIFKSPTCTPLDIAAVEALAKIAEVEDYKALAIEMFKVKSAVDGTPVRELVLRDFKDFSMNGLKVGVGQLEAIDGSVFDAIKDQLHADLATLKTEGERHTIMLLLTDIMKEGSELLVVSDDDTLIQRAFSATLENDRVWLEGVLSRKKQIIPQLEGAFS